RTQAFSLAWVLAIAAGLLLVSATALASSDTNYGQKNLGGGWNGARKALHDFGIDLRLQYLGEAGHNLSGGDSHETAYADQWHFGVTFDFDKLFGWTGGSLVVD